MTAAQGVRCSFNRAMTAFQSLRRHAEKQSAARLGIGEHGQLPGGHTLVVSQQRPRRFEILPAASGDAIACHQRANLPTDDRHLSRTSISAATPLARHIDARCPSNPNPVTSVAARTRRCSARSAPTRLRRDISTTAFLASAAEARPRLMAVVAMPVPRGFVSISKSPGRAAALVSNRRGSTNPVTANPKIGSGLRIVCPPTSVQPASCTLLAPRPGECARWPRAGRCSVGTPSKFNAVRRPPAHRVHVGKRVGRRDLPERKRVVHDGREEIHRLHERAAGAEAIDAGVVEGVGPDEQVRVAPVFAAGQRAGQAGAGPAPGLFGRAWRLNRRWKRGRSA